MASGAEIPRPPEDSELRNIIDKLAQFVARNGSEFENMTKQKQKDNPRFGFLFGGENYQYYIYKMNTEQAILRKNKTQPDQSSTQIQILQHQLKESEKNLRLQYDALMIQQQEQFDEATFVAERDEIQKLAETHRINLDEWLFSLQLIQISCSKDAIATNKKWFFNNCHSADHAEIMLKFLTNNVKCKASSFTFKLHVLYLVNDLVHHCMQKHMNHMQDMLGTYVSIMFCCVYTKNAIDSQREKLDKLRSIWQTQKYFSAAILDKLNDIEKSYEDYKQTVSQNYAPIVMDIGEKVQAQCRNYEMQHLQYSQHVQQQIAAIEMSQNIAVPLMTPNQYAGQQIPLSNPQSNTLAPRRSRFDEEPSRLSRISQSVQNYPANASTTQTGGPQPQHLGSFQGQDTNSMMAQQRPIFDQQPSFGSNGVPPRPLFQQWPMQGDFNSRNMPQLNMHPDTPFQQPSQNSQPGPLQPLMSIGTRPPQFQRQPSPTPLMVVNPGWQPRPSLVDSTDQRLQFRPQNTPPQSMSAQPPRPPMMDDQLLVPKVPYYDLPAALMVPLVHLSDNEYKPLDPSKIRLPPPMPPNERLIAAVDAFYAPPNHELPRDSDGWERLGLYEFFKAKQAAVKAKEKGDDSDGRRRHRSGSYSSNDSRKSGNLRRRSVKSTSRSPSFSPDRRKD